MKQLTTALILLVLLSSAVIAQNGTLRVEAEKGSSISVNRAFLGKVSDKTGRLVVTAIPAGRYVVMAMTPGKRPVTKKVVVQAGGLTEVSFLSAYNKAGDRQVPYAAQPARGVRGRFGRHPHHTRLLQKPVQKKGPSHRMTLTGTLMVSSPILMDDCGLTGIGITGDLRITSILSLSASLLTGFEDLDLDDGSWVSLCVGPKLSFGRGSFSWNIQPGIFISYLEGWYGWEYFDSTGYGISLLTGPQIRLGRRFSISAVLGIQVLLDAIEGREPYYYADIGGEPPDSSYWTSRYRLGAFAGISMGISF